MRSYLAIIPLVLFVLAGALVRLSGAGPDAIGAYFVASVVYLIGAATLFITFVVGCIDRSATRAKRSLSLVSHLGVVVLYLWPLASMAWDAYGRERVLIVYELQWRGTALAVTEESRVEVIGEFGTLTTTFPSEPSQRLQVYGQGFAHIITLRPGFFMSADDYIFYIKFPESVSSGYSSEWILPRRRGELGETYEFVHGDDSVLDYPTVCSDVSVKVIVIKVESLKEA